MSPSLQERTREAMHEPRTQQLLGWYTRVATSLDEYYGTPRAVA